MPACPGTPLWLLWPPFLPISLTSSLDLLRKLAGLPAVLSGDLRSRARLGRLSFSSSVVFPRLAELAELVELRRGIVGLVLGKLMILGCNTGESLLWDGETKDSDMNNEADYILFLRDKI